MSPFNNGKPFHGSEAVRRGKLKGATDTDYFYFLCPKCEGQQVLQILEYGVIKEGPPESYVQERPNAKMDFTLAFNVSCPNCKLLDFVKISNTGLQGGKLRGAV